MTSGLCGFVTLQGLPITHDRLVPTIHRSATSAMKLQTRGSRRASGVRCLDFSILGRRLLVALEVPARHAFDYMHNPM